MQHRFGTLLAAVLLFASAHPALAQQAVVGNHNTSRPLSELIQSQVRPLGQFQDYIVPNRFDVKSRVQARKADAIDPALQNAQGPSAQGEVLLSFDGVSDDDNAAVVGFRVVPPDTQGDVGPNHYVQHVNLAAEIFLKDGTSLSGPMAGNIFWQGLGDDCETSNSGDPITLYDDVNDRWVVTQFEATNPFAMCIAVSTSPDPMGSYHQYSFSFGADFPDYPKLGIWSTDDGKQVLVMTDRSFRDLAVFEGVFVSVFEYEQMLVGSASRMVRTNVPGTGEDGYLPADVDGAPAPAGMLPVVFGHETGLVKLYEADYDFDAGTISVDLIVSLPSVFDTALGDVQVPAPGSSLNVLTFAAMHRLQYRNFGTHQVLLTSAASDAGGDIAGVKWWEMREAAGAWAMHQEGTYAPADGLERWMPSIAMNGQGDIGLAYSAASTTQVPSIRFTGQTADQSGTGIMNVAETIIHAGGGVQTGANRWGDYSMTSVDPSDDLTFWHTNEYYAETGSFDFNTRIAHFSLGEGGGEPACDDIFLADTDGVTYCFDVVDEGDVACPGAQDERFIDGRVEGFPFNATGSVCKLGPEASSTAFGGTNEEADQGDGGCLHEFIDGFRVEADRAGPFTYSGTFSQLCDGEVADAFDWEGTFVKNFAPQIRRSGRNVFVAKQARAERREHGEAAEGFALEANYPNPFNPTTQIAYTLPEAAHATLTVFNALGQEVARLVDGFVEPGTHRVTFDASRLSAGAYLYVLEAGGFRGTGRMVLLK